MKLKLLSLVAAAGFFFASCGTTYNTTSTSDNAAYNVDVPTNIRSGFAVAYPDAANIVWNRYDVIAVPIDWELTGWNTLGPNDYVATFNYGNDAYYTWYDANGNLIGTVVTVTDYSKVPYVVNTMIQDKYNGYTVDSIEREINGSTTNYEIKLTNGDDKIKLLVDSNGNILKEKKG